MTFKKVSRFRPSKFVCAKFCIRFIIGASFVFAIPAVASNLSFHYEERKNLSSSCEEALMILDTVTKNNKSQNRQDQISVKKIDYDHIELIPDHFPAAEMLLFESILEGDIDTVRALVDMPRINLNVKDKQKNTPLILATKLGNLEMVKTILNSNKKIKVNKTDSKGDTAFLIATRMRQLDIMDELLKQQTIDLTVSNFRNEDINILYAAWFVSEKNPHKRSRMIDTYTKIVRKKRN